MGKIIIIIFASFSMLFIEDAGAQEAKRFDRAAFEAKRNAYIMAEIGLTPEEAAEFIPLLRRQSWRKNIMISS